MLSIPEIKSALLRAADWLQAHPDHHVAGDLATDGKGKGVLPTDPDAECFCGLGRFAKEANLNLSMGRSDGSIYAPFNEMLSQLGHAAHEIYEVNDREVTSPQLACNGLVRGNPAVFDTMRNMAK